MKNDRLLRYINIILCTVAIIAIFITLVFLYSLCKNYTIFNGNLEIQDTGSVGDFFGGVIGSLIGLISVLLLYKTLRYQQKDIENNETSSRLQWTTDLILKLIDDLKSKDCYINILELKDELGESDVFLTFARGNIYNIHQHTAKLSLEFRVLNKLVYQEKFDVSEMNLLRLIIFNSLGNDFFNFLNNINEFVSDSEQLRLINDDDDLVIKFQEIKRNIERVSVNSSYNNRDEILSIINNYRAEDDLQGLRLNDWLEITGRVR